MNAKSYCQYCGEALESDWEFCEGCGRRAPAPSPAPAASPPAPAGQQPVPSAAPPPVVRGQPAPIQAARPPAAAQPRPTPAPALLPGSSNQRSSNWLILGSMIGCLGLLCIGVLVVSGFLYFRSQDSGPEQAAAPVLSTPDPQASKTPYVPYQWKSPTPEPGAEETPASDPVSQPTSPAGSPPQPQGITPHQSFTRWPLDYSLGWELAETDVYITDINQDQSWMLGLKKPESIVIVIPPHELAFTSAGVNIQVKIKPAEVATAGPFGVICNFQDENNYYLVEIWDVMYGIGKMENGVFVPLSDPYWQPSQFINETGSNGFVEVGVSCVDYSIGLMINGLGETFPVYDPGESFSGGASALFGASSQEAVDMLMGLFYFKELVIEAIE